jgi:hypothetical protein
LQASVACIGSYVSFDQEKYISSALSEDLVVDAAHITLMLRNEKGKKASNKGSIPCGKWPSETLPGLLRNLLATSRESRRVNA